MVVKIGVFTPPYFGSSEYYDVDLGTNDYDTIIILGTYNGENVEIKTGIAISSSINNRSAFDTAYGRRNTTANECLDGTHPFFKLINDRQTLRLTNGNIAWSAFTTYYLLLKFNQVIA